ncbi:MAG: ligand-binding protein SH3 [Spirochaetae bacterium HGW-Spirochaetae-8]|nr:MAG: ligand-binding protein SH3 [Spirochaetae bacterium HGW-Spirochaetae-8]
MQTNTILGTIVLGLLPISELRGAIPFAYFRGMPLLWASLLGVGANLLVSPLAYVFLSFVHRFFYERWQWYIRLFDRTVARTRAKLAPKVATLGFLGVLLFVGIPLPITGAWTGTLGAWVLGLDRKKSILAVSAGVLMSGTIVTVIILLGKGAGSLFVKII